MQFPRTKLVEKFAELFAMNSTQYIGIISESGVGKSSFLTLIQESGTFTGHTVERLDITDSSELSTVTLKEKNPEIILIDIQGTALFSDIRTFIERESPDSRVIYTNIHSPESEEVVVFPIEGISFREYSEGMGTPLDIASIMSGSADLNELNSLRDMYVRAGSLPANIENPDDILSRFDEKVAIMNSQLFKKEHNTFLEFIRTLAMTTGDLYKEDGIAKMMDISRRKVRKYTELLMEHNMIHPVGPFVENTATELSRHVKLYWKDLADYASALGVSYYHGEGKKGVLENFVLLELERKLKDTHDIKFYRKKSGAEVTFVLIDKSSSRLSPIVLVTRSSDAIPQALKSFHESYSDRIDHSMVLNQDRILQTSLDGTAVIVLPHVAI